MLFQNLNGSALQSAHFVLARYCITLEEHSGSVNISFAITALNKLYKFVEPEDLDGLINDISNAYIYVKNQQNSYMSRAGYWKWQTADTVQSAKQDMIDALAQLGIPVR